MNAFSFDDILLVPNFNRIETRKDTDISMLDKQNKAYLEIPVFASPMDTVTGPEMSDWLGDYGAGAVLPRFQKIEDQVEAFKKCNDPKPFVAVGTSDKEMDRVTALRDAGAEKFCIDVAHAYAEYVRKTLERMIDLLPYSCIMAGNVATYEAAEFLATYGADLIRVGVGGGSACSTRVKTGFGIPTLTSVRACADLDRSIIADGGIRTPGDIAKALALGADYVMLGSMLAGTYYSPGDACELSDSGEMIPVDIDRAPSGQTYYKIFRGMSSESAVVDAKGSLDSYKTDEGVEAVVPYKDKSTSNRIMQDIEGGLRSALTYAGAQNIKEMQRKINWVQITDNGLRESVPHILKG